MINQKFWKNKKVFITGHTGFKGSWLSNILISLNAKVYGYSLRPESKTSPYNSILKKKYLYGSSFADIKNYTHLKKKIDDFKPDIIFHLAAQPLVIEGYKDPYNTFITNFNGTLNILEIFKESKQVKTLINITSDKCYKPSKKKLKESDTILGVDPYSNSKSCSELVSYSYLSSYFKMQKKGFATVRAGNVIGGGDWSKDRIIPDIIRSIYNKKKFFIRNPNAVRPWQHIIELSLGYLILAERLFKSPLQFSSSYNFGPSKQNFKNVKYIHDFFFNVNKSMNFNKKKSTEYAENPYLTLDTSYTHKMLKWKSKLSLDESLSLTNEWYKLYYKGYNMFEYSTTQFKEYLKIY